MEKIIQKLSSIEHAAVSITDQAQEEKKSIKEEMDKLTQTFDIQSEKDTSKKLASLKKELDDQIESELSNLRTNAENDLKALEEKYARNHSEIAQKIFESIIKE